MALVVILIIMVMGVGIVGTLYSSISPFIYKLGTISQYNVAYYGAMMGAERGLLALRNHDAGFEGRSFISTGNTSDNVRATFAASAVPFGMFTKNATYDAGWTITSRVPSIPAPGQGNVESVYATGDSQDYNTLGYFEGLSLPLYLDNATGMSQYYTPINPTGLSGTFTNLDHIEATFRLPKKITAELGNNFGLAQANDIDDDTIGDDVIINRGLQGNDTAPAGPGLTNGVFSIIPTIKQDFTSGNQIPYYVYDNAIRESTINGYTVALPNNIDTTLSVSNLGFSLSQLNGGLISGHNIIPVNSTQKNEILTDIIASTQTTDLALNFSIINRMEDAAGNVYPFLEWKIKLCGIGVGCPSTLMIADRFFTLQGKGHVGDYTATINLRKPVRETSNAAGFAIIF